MPFWQWTMRERSLWLLQSAMKDVIQEHIQSDKIMPKRRTTISSINDFNGLYGNI